MKMRDFQIQKKIYFYCRAPYSETSYFRDYFVTLGEDIDGRYIKEILDLAISQIYP